MKPPAIIFIVVALSASAWAQDQQLGARTKAMGGSYTAFEDDPVSVWLNPAGIATQLTSASIAYQTYTTYPLHENHVPFTNNVTFSAGAQSTFVDPAIVPSYLGFVFHLGEPDSGMALGICYARPYNLTYSFDQVADPAQQQFSANSNINQSFSRFRIALAKDWRTAPDGFFTHFSVGVGVDAGYERWEFTSPTASLSDNATAFAYGAGFLAGIFDNGDTFKMNLGLAYQSAVDWKFSIDPQLAPAFNMPQQFNAGLTFYMLSGLPLRATLDMQWINWRATADAPLFPDEKRFRDAVNASIGLEYRTQVLKSQGIDLYPRLGYRRFEAPWSNKNDLPMTSNFKLVLDTKAADFNIVTFGIGLAWQSDGGKTRSVDVGADVGGDAYNIALGFNYEF